MSSAGEKRKVFISYAREDQVEAEKIYKYLSDADFDPWMDVHDIVSGNDWLKSITQAIKEADYFLALLSANSVNNPGVLQEELDIALEICEKIPDPDVFLIPIRLEDCSIPDRISQYQWVDMFAEDGWVRLLRALHKKRQKKRAPTRSLLAVGTILIFALIIMVWNNLFSTSEPDYERILDTCDASDSQTSVKVGIAPLPENCAMVDRESLENKWNFEKAEITTLDQPVLSSKDAHTISDYDLVIWASCNEEFTLTYELTTSRKPAEVFEPTRLQIPGDSAEITEIGNALIDYQHGDYENASRRFASLDSTANPYEQAMFWANSLLFNRNYSNAISVYEAYTLEKEPGGTYNNVGVALFNLKKEELDEKKDKQESGFIYDGLTEFGQAIEIAIEQGNDDLAVLAYVNRSDLYRRLSQLENATADCSAAREHDSQRDHDALSALPYICRARLNFTESVGSGERIPLEDIDRDIILAGQYSDSWPSIPFLRGTWFLEKKQYDEAVASFEEHFTRMENQACLKTDLDYLEDASRAINKYSH